MNNFEILKICDEKYNVLIVMTTYEAAFQYLNEIAKMLAAKKYSGIVLIDELMHSGNNDDRFIKGYFDGEEFDNSAFSFESVDRRSEIRKYSCELLKDIPDIIDCSILNKNQKSLISKGVYI